MCRSKCNKQLYKSFLEATMLRYSGKCLSEVSPKTISHDSVSRWLKSKTYRPSEIWKEVKNHINLKEEGTLILDDTLLEKDSSKEIELVKCQYSGSLHGLVKGISLVNAVYHQGEEFTPVDFRIYSKEEDGKTKNDHFKEMISLAKKRGLNFKVVVADTWYSSLKNLKSLRDQGLYWVMGLKKNRRVDIKKILEDLHIPQEGLKTHLQGYGWITVFRIVDPNGYTRYFGTNLSTPTLDDVKRYFKARWSIEVYHREIKQTCGISCCQSRASRAQRNHILLAILAWIEQRRKSCIKNISIYRLQWENIASAVLINFRNIYALN